MISRPRRSVLFMPGDNPRAQKKASGLAADVIILDLEDAVAPANKDTARDQVLSTLRQHPFGRREVIVRVNRLDSHWGSDDLAALSRTNPDGILLPRSNPLTSFSRLLWPSPRKAHRLTSACGPWWKRRGYSEHRRHRLRKQTTGLSCRGGGGSCQRSAPQRIPPGTEPA
ncbi:MAG: hypothetical protein Ct9H300mP16_12200 [Pseudomonadota bacterium]|nr:MAG: hypothetical protein Ct9H300mP16_12200 [Pseudomonadota bacterium]